MTRIAFLVVVVAAWGCQRRSELFCEKNPDQCSDGSTEAQMCGMCTAPTPVCNAETNLCVACNTSLDCSGTTPVCDNHDCRACSAHTECASGACLPNGACAPPGSVAFVQEGGTDNATCDASSPCGHVTAAVATMKKTIKITGTIDEHVAGLDIDGLVIVAAPNARLTYTGSGGSILDVAGGAITVAGLQIGGTVTTPSLNFGVTLTGGALTLKGVTIDRCYNGAIKVSAGQLVLHQSTVSNNNFGGLDLDGPGATFDISNNFIFRNGDSSTGMVGGIRVLQFAPSGTNKIEFNTIVDNHMQSTSTQAGGLYCLTTVSTTNNIVARNDVAGNRTATNANQFGDCAPVASYVGADIVPLNFESPDNPPFNYRIQTGSIAIDQGTAPTSITYDVDGNHRPARTNNDQGAFELQ